MKNLKTWHLFAFVIVLFIASFSYINVKYDRFYRVKGINNENRQLIIRYLSKEEQNYLVENQIPISKFIKFIRYKNFRLQNYQYYNMLQDTARYTSKKQIIKTGNAIVDTLSARYDSSFYNLARTIIDDDLEYALIHNKNFNDSYVTSYSYMRPLYSKKNTAYVEDTATYISQLAQNNITGDDAANFLEEACDSYTAKSLKVLMSKANDPDIRLVLNPSANNLVLNSTSYIGSYVPQSLVMIQDVDRLKYSMYLRYDAYKALVKLIKQAKKQKDNPYIYQAYTSYKELSASAQGHDEFQLGMSVKFSSSSVTYSQFAQTKTSAWLEANAYKYGFVLRYPKDKTVETGHAYDAHVYRYVGTKLAKTMHDDNLCLEEANNERGNS